MLILAKEQQKKTQFRLRISEKVMQEISDYCEWAGIKYRDYFIEQACQYIFANDDDWKKHKKSNKNQNK